MKKRAIVIGGTGATGRHLIKQLLLNDNWGDVTSIGRKSVLKGKKHDKLEDIVIDSLYNLSSTKTLWKNQDVFFNCIGTTRKRAGSAKKFIEIEFGISMIAAQLAADANIPHASLVSARGANPNQWALDWIHPLLYIRTMGQKEQTLITNIFDRASIFRPGLLNRLMDDNWIGRTLKDMDLGLRVDDLASVMIYDAENSNVSSIKKPVITYLDNNKIKSIVKNQDTSF